MSSLVLWEFSRKQDYIFKSNKLKECIGASIIIKNLSENFNKFGLKNENFVIKGGGKSLYIFDDKTEANKFIKEFSTNILRKYPGLEFFIVSEPVDIINGDIKNAISKLYKNLETKKSMRKNSENQIGFGIERECESTGYPASFYYYDDNKKYISSEVEAKRNEENNIEGHKSKDYFEDIIPEGYKYSKEIDDLISENGKNYIAVVHIDGNGMGKKLRSIKDKIIKEDGETQENYNKRYINVLKNFSIKIDKSYKDVFNKMVLSVINNKEIKDYSKMDEKIIPLRPLIFAGDDVTYLSNAYIGVETARIFLEELEKNDINIDDVDFGKLHACAGISITKKGYPFIKGYTAAEELCQNSKRIIIEKGYADTSVLDFHISQGDMNKSIYNIRQDEYRVNSNKINLTMKPLVLDPTKDWKNYNNFITSLDNIRNSIKDKNIGRNKIKELRRALKKGKENTEYFLKFYKIKPGKYLRDFSGASGDYCFNESDNICMYLDAIEIMDMFIKL